MAYGRRCLKFYTYGTFNYGNFVRNIIIHILLFSTSNRVLYKIHNHRNKSVYFNLLFQTVFVFRAPGGGAKARWSIGAFWVALHGSAGIWAGPEPPGGWVWLARHFYFH